MPFLVVDSISKIYRPDGPASAVAVLRDVTVCIEEGEFVAVMGPSGSGKTTLLSVMGAMNRPTHGRLTVDGIEVYRLSDERLADFRREYVGFVFQQHHLLPFLTALENVSLPLAVERIGASEARARAKEALRRVQLDDKADRLPDQLSGGEQGRVAIARALVNNPPLLLADEPTGNLDSATGAEVMKLFAELNAQRQSIVMVTHNPENAVSANRIIRLRDGRIE
ncbi:MAG: ABC transporter ATP-binding protein [Acidobacteria bacterium]|nr:ABC transporter ATP-binding protein [Acidobacteriota bacterium]